MPAYRKMEQMRRMCAFGRYNKKLWKMEWFFKQRAGHKLPEKDTNETCDKEFSGGKGGGGRDKCKLCDPG